MLPPTREECFGNDARVEYVELDFDVLEIKVEESFILLFFPVSPTSSTTSVSLVSM